MVALLKPAVASKGVADTVDTPVIEKRGAEQHHHHRVESHQHQAHWIQSDNGKKQAGHHHHVSATHKKTKTVPQPLSLHNRHRPHRRKQVRRKKKTHKKPAGHKKPIEHNDKECGKRGDASVSILVCNNRTISAVYCPHGKLPHPDAWARSLVKRDLLTALNHGKHRHHSHAHKPHHDHHDHDHDHPNCRPSKSPEVVHTDVIPMHKPCPKSDRKDIADTFKQLTCPDQALLSPLLGLGSFTKAAINAVDRHNTDGDCKDEHHWQDKCTDVGTFCGIDLFGCNSIDDGLYYCDAIGNDPQLLEVCGVGACVSRRDRNGAARCGDDTCTCAETGYICGSSFPKTCRLDENSLYFCTAGKKPVLHQKCTGSSCPAGSNVCSKDPIDTQCLCQAPGTICGSAFPKECGLTPKALYVCSDEGELPKFLEDNSEGCTTDKDDCLCTNAGDYCGSSFPVSCGLKASALYTCSAKGEGPIFKNECPSGQCPANGHECGAVSKCVCTEKGDLCGSTFPSECNLRTDAVYTCLEIGDTPIFKKGCPSGVCRPNADDCEEEMDCVCPGAGDFCGSNFADDCDLKPNSIYSCTGKGERPVFKEECPSGQCRRSTNTCVPARNCLCKEKGTVRVLRAYDYKCTPF
ncbi:hypothetical protein BGZ70_001313 [Mortierella alpina]|uniref:Uncharacterized protein n=1 Tax=Mortierella alpina TaxID=64518 RepID=A0A9P6JC92_MORAP|nr:hypothetical protein BGZ70_001313 [Mortierella alpina]